jgi:hypothetical protein
MAITEYPAVGTRIRGEWKHPFEPGTYENVEGTVVDLIEPLTAPQPEGAGLSEDEANFLIAIGALEGRVALRIDPDTLDRGQDEASTVTESDLSGTYSQYAFEDVTILD